MGGIRLEILLYSRYITVTNCEQN